RGWRAGPHPLSAVGVPDGRSHAPPRERQLCRSPYLAPGASGPPDPATRSRGAARDGLTPVRVQARRRAHVRVDLPLLQVLACLIHLGLLPLTHSAAAQPPGGLLSPVRCGFVALMRQRWIGAVVSRTLLACASRRLG